MHPLILIPDPNSSNLLKRYFIYDDNYRIVIQYIAANTAITGSSCIMVYYTYVDTTTSSVQAIREELSTWDSTWG